MSYTKGPWKQNQYGELKGADKEQVTVWGAGVAFGNRSAVTEANARLIQSAPELLEALQAIVNDLPSRRDWLDPVVEAMARAAIKKATDAATVAPEDK